MKTNVMLITVNHRNEAADKLQKTLTAWGCMIKTRLGLHTGVLDNCTQCGLIFLELAGEIEKQEEMLRKVNLIKGVNAKRIEMEIEEE